MNKSLIKNHHWGVIRGLGMFVFSWSILEAYLEVAIAKQLGLSPRDGSLVTASLQFKGRATLLKGLLNRNPEKYEKPIELLNEIMNKPYRNDLLHSRIGVAPAGLVFERRKSDGKLKVSASGHTEETLQKLGVEIAQIGEALFDALGITDDDFREYWAYFDNVQVSHNP
jgi:hypothetical protein